MLPMPHPDTCASASHDAGGRLPGRRQTPSRQPGIGRPVGGTLRELIVSRGRSGYLARYSFDVGRQRIWVLRIRHQRESGYTDDEV